MTRTALCDICERSLRPAPEQWLSGVGVVHSAFRHRGAARLLVHHLKYRGVVAAGERLAEAMATHVPAGCVLVPVTRVGWRRLRYGIDPATELARALRRLTGVEMVEALSAPFFGRARAGRAHGFAPRYRSTRRVAGPVILVDDVITTGATLTAAARAFPGLAGAVTATTSGRVARTMEPDPEWTSVPGGGHHPTE